MPLKPLHVILAVDCLLSVFLFSKARKQHLYGSIFFLFFFLILAAQSKILE